MENIDKSNSTQIWDPLMKATISVIDNTIVVSRQNGSQHQYYIPKISFNQEPNNQVMPIKPYLKLLKNGNSQITLNPSGLGLMCKSDRIQQVDMSMSFQQGCHYWSFFCSTSTLGFAVGVKAKHSKKQEIFDIPIHGTKMLTFRLDLNTNEFRCWVNGSASSSKPTKKLIENEIWTPFVRIRQAGTTVLLNPFISDPLNEIQPMNQFNSILSSQIPKDESIIKSELPPFSIEQQKNYNLISISQDCIAIYTQNNIKFLYRNKFTQEFDFNFAYETDEKSLAVELTEGEWLEIKKFEQKVKVQLIGEIYQKDGKFYIIKSPDQWVKWGQKTFALLDTLLNKLTRIISGKQAKEQLPCVSVAWTNRMYQIISSKIQQVRPWIYQQCPFNLASQLDRQFILGLDQSVFKLPKMAFLLPSSLYLNNIPSFSFQAQIGQVDSTEHFCALRLKGSDRIVIYNIEAIPYKIGDFSLCRGLKKELELTQFKNEIEDIRQDNFSQPSIYKILKNCLKYADKVKPPQKLAKELQEKKIKKKKQEVKQQLQPDKSSLNTLHTMGFNHTLAKKVLIECKNNLQSAIQTLLSKYSQAMKPSDPPTKDWICSLCTLKNDKTALLCAACSNPPPVFEQLPQQEQTKQQEPKIEVIQDVASQKLEEIPQSFYIWETKIGTCPLILISKFGDRLRVRLIGPNPKYYSLFYIKQQGFFDFTTMSCFQNAHQIDQRPIRYINYLISTKQELKENAFGWIGLEDYDIKYKKKIYDMQLCIEQNQKCTQHFKIYLLNNNQGQYQPQIIEGKLLINNAYAEKKKCLSISPQINIIKIMQIQDGKQQIDNNYQILKDNQGFRLQQKRSKNVTLKNVQINNIKENSIPQNGFLDIYFTHSLNKNDAKFKGFQSNFASSKEKNISETSFIPLIIVSQLNSTATLQHNNVEQSIDLFPNRIIFKNQHNNSMIIQSVILERVGKPRNTKQKKNGFIYTCNDLTQLPIQRFAYEFSDDTKKVYVNLNQSVESLYLVVVPVSQTNQETANEEQFVFEISLSGALGKTIENTLQKTNLTNIISDKLKLQAKVLQNQGQTNKIEVNTSIQVISNKLDLSLLNNEKKQKLIFEMIEAGIPIDLRVRIGRSQSQAKKRVFIQKIQVENWIQIKRVFSTSPEKKQTLSLENYTEKLKLFLETSNPSLISQLVNPIYSSYREIITKMDINEFISSILLRCPNKKTIQNKYSLFLRVFSSDLAKNTWVDPNKVFKNMLQNQQTTGSGVELAFELFKIYKLPQNTLTSKLLEITQKIQENRKPQYREARKNNQFGLHLENSLFSDYYFNLVEKDKSAQIQNTNLINHRSLIKKGNLFKKFVLDLLSVYDISKVYLVLGKSTKQTKFRVQVSFINELKQQIKIKDYYYSQIVWNQLSKAPYSSSTQKLFKNPLKNGLNTLALQITPFKCRYMILEINFTLLPNIGSRKELQNMPKADIKPQVYGDYAGEQQSFLEGLFSQVSPSHQLKDIQDIMIEKSTVNLKQIRQQIQTGIYKQTEKTVQCLMSQPSKDNLSYWYQLACLIMDDLNHKEAIFQNNQLVNKVLEILVNQQKGPITDRSILLLKRFIRNEDNAYQMLKLKIVNENIFNILFKDYIFDEDKLLKLLKQNQDNISLFTNVCWAIKSKDVNNVELLEKIVNQSNIKNKIKDSIFIFEKYGWINGVQDSLQLLIKDKKQSHVKIILQSSKSNLQLAQFAVKCLRDNFDIFCLCFQYLQNPKRKTKLEDIKDILVELLSLISTAIDNDENEVDITEKFTYILSVSNAFGCQTQISNQIIQTFFRLPHRNVFLRQFLNSQLMNKGQNYQKTILECCNLLNSVKQLDSDTVQLIKQLLIFIISKNQTGQNEAIKQLSLSKNISLIVIQTLSCYLKKYLNIGGADSIKMIDSYTAHQITLATNLAQLLAQSEIYSSINQETLRKMLKWLFVNTYLEKDHNIKTKISVNFAYIQKKVWKIVTSQQKNSNYQFSAVFRDEFDKHTNELIKINNKLIKNIYEKKKFYCLRRVLKQYSDKNSILCDKLVKDSCMINVLLQQIANVSSFQQDGQTFSPQSKQLSSLLQLRNNTEKTKEIDWTTNKSGNKKCVFQIKYPISSNRSSYQMLFNVKEPITLMRLIMAFDFSSNNSKTSCIPKEILVQAGQKLEKMRFLGKLQQIPDDFYLNNYSVKLFGLNTNKISKKNGFIGSLNKNTEVKYLRFTIKPSQVIGMYDAPLDANKTEVNNASSSINFLSIQGFNYQKFPQEIQNIVACIDILNNQKHSKLIQECFNVPQIVKLLQNSLLNMSTLMKNILYSTIIHKFLMRICEKNNEFGNQMLNEYLTMSGTPQICAKMCSEIILSNHTQTSARLEKFFNFILDCLKSTQFLHSESLEYFLKRFDQITFIMQQDKSKFNKSVNLKIPDECIYQLLIQQTLNISQLKFLRAVLTLEQPISITGFNLTQILSYLYKSKNQQLLQFLAALIVANKACRVWFSENKYLDQVYQNSKNMIEKKQDVAELTKNLNFLSYLCGHPNIKSILNKCQYNLRVFQLMFLPENGKLLMKQENTCLRTAFVNFIAVSALGSENQKIVGAMLKDSLSSIMSESNKKFVSQIFLPLLNSYLKVPISIIPYDSQENKIIEDISNFLSTQVKPIPTSAQSSIENKKIKLPSVILLEKDKEKFLNQFKQIKQNVAGKFTLVASHNAYAKFLLQTIKKKILYVKQSFVIIFKTASFLQNEKGHVVGLYYDKQSNTQNSNNSFNWTKNSFIFLFAENDQPKFWKFDAKRNPLLIQLIENSIISEDSMDENYKSQLLLCLKHEGNSFIELSYQMESNGVFSLDTLVNKGVLCEEQITSVQYWLFEPENVSNTKKSQFKKIQENPSLTHNFLKSIKNTSYFRSDFECMGFSKYLRYENVYELPKSITIAQVKRTLEIMNCPIKKDQLGSVDLALLDNVDSINDQTTLQKINRKLQGDGKGDVIDLTLNFNKMMEIIDFKSKTAGQKSEFLPQKGILKHFSQNDGVTEMIKVLSKSIQVWNNPQRKAKWLQYVKQLQSFSKFPHFFSMYLKDNQTVPLLFNLMAGVPDKEADKKWDQLQNISSQKLLRIVADILKVDKTLSFRQYAMKNNFISAILDRLRLLTGHHTRKWESNIEQQEEKNTTSPSKAAEDDGSKKIKKKKGVGYGSESSSSTKWMKGIDDPNQKQKFQAIEIILKMVQNFLDVENWQIPKQVLNCIYQSCFLPFIEDCLRAGTLLEISKDPQKFKLVFKILRTFSKHLNLVPLLIEIPKNYQPRQIESLEQLMNSLQKTAKIFLSCLQQNTKSDKDKISEELAKDIIQTFQLITEAIQNYKQLHNHDDQQDNMKNILELPLEKKYRALLKDLRFGYIDMKQGANKIKHHYSSSFTANYVPNQTKMIRLAQQLADISTALPYEHTNAVYVRCDKDRVDYMQALIMGSNGTPYGHGAFLFDVYFDDNYPNNPPKVNLTTTGHGKVRFNPNLYACGKVCLSLLGTWRGSQSQNWDAKVSTLLQVLLSIQAIIMSEQVYFNEPGFQGQQGTEQGQKKNEAYSNIVRYCNIKFAMIQNLKNPPKGFQTVIKRHFYVKKAQILQQCNKWLLYAAKRKANYQGLVNDHNSSWCVQFRKSTNQYKEMLQKAIKELQQQLNKLQPPSIKDITSTTKKNNRKKEVQNKNMMADLQKHANDQEIDVTYDKNIIGKEINLDDDQVKDRWSRYIGAMGIDAVSKQAKADLLIFGLNPMAMEIIKNIVLSGCRRLVICDEEKVSFQDLAGGFFYSEEDIGKYRVEACLQKIKQLNIYVKVQTIKKDQVTQQNIKKYTMIIITEMKFTQQIKLNEICRAQKVKFISTECRSVFSRYFCDFGEEFQVLDKNGEQPVQLFIKDITNEESGVVTLIDGAKSPFEDGQAVLIRQVQGMQSIQDPKKSINETIHTVKTINSKSFRIGNTTQYQKYIRNGTIKNIKTPLKLNFITLNQHLKEAAQNLSIQQNLMMYDFTKMENSKLIHFCFVVLDMFIEEQSRHPLPWNLKDSDLFMDKFKQIWKQEIKPEQEKLIRLFAMTSIGNLPPLCAFMGGFVAQQIVKGITQKYKPVKSSFYCEFSELLPQMPESLQHWNQQNLSSKYNKKSNRNIGLEIVIGSSLLNQIKNAKLFMIGAGAIGCQLLKNFAMISFGTGQLGKITLTDPDHIENSNLNRQFLFREKHISKPKSRTAAASVQLMNPYLKGHIFPLLQRVSQSTKNIFSNKFFQSLTLVANALDNVAARRYVDQRCVQNKIALFQSGTLGPKGHVQVIIPYLTESYGSQNDPAQQGQIPHCTLKMFPQQTLHCVQWARDIFGKKFSLQPKALLKVLDDGFKPQKQDIKSLKQCLVMVTKGPKNFHECIAYAVNKFYKYYRNDISQLIYTYPLDAKTKNGQPFWKLPKRPPVPIKQFDPENLLHCTFVASLAVLIAKIYKLDYPKQFRTEKQKKNIGLEASKIKIPEFVPSDEKAKQILKESQQKKQKDQSDKIQQQIIQSTQHEQNQNHLHKEVLQKATKKFQIQTEEFEKDDDSNGHIDFIYSAANLRALNYKLDPMDWITTKIKAGRIVPALATTTTSIAGLQTIEICKYLKKIKIDKHKNAFLNLAVPSLNMSEPGEVKKVKLNQNIQVTLWDRWEVKCTENTTFGQLYDELKNKYGLSPAGVLQGMSKIDSESDKNLFMKSKLSERLDRIDDYADIVVLFKKGEEDKLLQGVPPIRIRFTV